MSSIDNMLVTANELPVSEIDDVELLVIIK